MIVHCSMSQSVNLAHAYSVEMGSYRSVRDDKPIHYRIVARFPDYQCDLFTTPSQEVVRQVFDDLTFKWCRGEVDVYDLRGYAPEAPPVSDHSLSGTRG